MKPEIIAQDYQGAHNKGKSLSRVATEGLYKNCSTVCIVPTRGQITAKVVQNWLGMMTPMNQKFTRVFAIGLEVGEAYEQTLDAILSNLELKKWKFVLTLEEDNLIPPDGLIRLLQQMHKHPELDAIGGLYWTKGEGGQPMCYGDPKTFPKNFIPFAPKDTGVTECNGLGMGFTLFRMKVFTSGKIEKPWFKTLQTFDPGKGSAAMTQDLYFFEKAGKAGFRFGCSADVRVGHYDYENDKVW